MENLPLSDFQQIIETDIEILFSELSSITADKTGLLITIVALIFSGYNSDLGKQFPAWIPISLIVIITWSMNEISTKYYDFESSQSSQKSSQTVKSAKDPEKTKILYLLDLKSKFSLIKPFLVSLLIIIFVYFLVLSYYFYQLDPTILVNRTSILLTVILFLTSVLILGELIFPDFHIIKFCIKYQNNPSRLKNFFDYLVDKILKSGLKIQVYILPFCLIVFLFANQINQNLMNSMNDPISIVFIIGQFVLWMLLVDIFAIEQAKKILRRKIKWLSSLKSEVFEQRIKPDKILNTFSSQIEKYLLTNLFSYNIREMLFFFSDFSMNYDINLALNSPNDLIMKFVKLR